MGSWSKRKAHEGRCGQQAWCTSESDWGRFYFLILTVLLCVYMRGPWHCTWMGDSEALSLQLIIKCARKKHEYREQGKWSKMLTTGELRGRVELNVSMNFRLFQN